MQRSIPLPMLEELSPTLCRMGHTANIFRSSDASTRRTAVSSPRSTTLSVPCHTLSRQSAPRQPPEDGFGGSLNTWALSILRRTRSITSSWGVELVVLGSVAWNTEVEEDAAVAAAAGGVVANAVLGLAVVDEALVRAVALRNMVELDVGCDN